MEVVSFCNDEALRFCYGASMMRKSVVVAEACCVKSFLFFG
jgi:hypothetical protein